MTSNVNNCKSRCDRRQHERTAFLYFLALGRILGWILVPLWTIAIAGLIK
jgi:hypothetical protein